MIEGKRRGAGNHLETSDDATMYALCVLVITLGMAVLQFLLKPFEESAEEASGGWRTSPNRQVCPAHMAPAIICLLNCD